MIVQRHSKSELYNALLPLHGRLGGLRPLCPGQKGQDLSAGEADEKMIFNEE